MSYVNSSNTLILTSEEKEMILNKRLNNLDTSIKKGSWTINLTNLDKDSFLLTTRDEYKDTSTSHTLMNEDAYKIFSFLNDRYKIIKQIESIQGESLNATV